MRFAVGGILIAFGIGSRITRCSRRGAWGHQRHSRLSAGIDRRTGFVRCDLVVIVFLLVASALPRRTAGPSFNTIDPETVVVPSGSLRLTGLLWKPEGSGPFPAILFSHGSGRRVESTLARERAYVVGPVFARHGYALLYLFRRGYGLSAGQGEFMEDVLDREAAGRGEEARRHLEVVLLTTDHLDDVKAGLSFLRRRAGVDPDRIAAVGHSLGGQLTLLLAAKRDERLRAAVIFAAAAQSWVRVGAELQERMLSAVRNISAPIFLTHAANDYSILPAQVMAAELARLGRPHQLKIYPAGGSAPAAGHAAVYTDIASWKGDVFRFLDEHMRRR